MQENAQPKLLIADDFRQRLRNGEKFDCPCCGRHSQIYKWKITGAMVFSMAQCLRLQRGSDDGYVHHSKFMVNISRGFYNLKYFDMIEQKRHGVPGADQRTSGRWRVTAKGIHFLRGEITAPKYALVFDDACMGYAGEEFGVRECLPEKFSYEELRSYVETDQSTAPAA